MSSGALIVAGSIRPIDAAPVPPPIRPALSVGYFGLFYLDRSTELRRELGLSVEQQMKLTAQRELLAKLAQVRGQDREWVKALKSIDRTIADLLTPAELLRLRQIVLQQFEEGGLAGSNLAELLPEVAGELKLSDDHNEKLRKAGLLQVLSDDQKQHWREMVGPRSRVNLTGRTKMPMPLPASLESASDENVRVELKLTEAQQERIAELRTRWDNPRWATPEKPCRVSPYCPDALGVGRGHQAKVAVAYLHQRVEIRRPAGVAGRRARGSA